MSVDTIEGLEIEVHKAEDLWRGGDWQRALETYCALFNERWHHLDGHSKSLTAADLTILERIADLAVPFGEYTLADKLLEIAARGYSRLGSEFWADYATIKRIHIAFGNALPYEARILFRTRRATLGDVESLEFNAQGFAKWESSYRLAPSDKSKNLLYAGLYVELGRLLMLLGRYASALSAFERGTHHANSGDLDSTYSTHMHLRLGVAQCLLEKGELQKCSVELGTIEPRIQRRQHPGHLTTFLEIQAKLNLLLGDFGSAQRNLLRVWSTCNERGFKAPALRAFLNLAQLLILLNKTVEAKALLNAARIDAALLNDNSLAAQIERLLQLAQSRSTSASGAVPSVQSLQDDSDSIGTNRNPVNVEFEIETRGLGLNDFEERSLQFHWYLAIQNGPAAERCLARLESFRSSDSALIQLGLITIQAMFAYYRGQFREADIGFRSVHPGLSQLKLMPQRWQVQVLWKRCLERLDVDPAEQARLAADNEMLLEQIGLSLPLQDRIVFLLNKPSQDEEELARLVWALQDLDLTRRSNLLQESKYQLRVWRGLNQLIDRMYRQKEVLASRTLRNSIPTRKWPSNHLWRQILFCPRKRAFLIFLSLPDSIFIARLSWMSTGYHIIRTGRQRVRELVKKWHESVAVARPDVAREVSHILSNELGIPSILSALPNRVNALTLLPDDVLHGFPFAAIELGGKYLVERYALSVGYQLGPQRKSRKLVSGPQRALLVGITAGHPKMPRTKDQIERVQDWLGSRGIPSLALWNRCANSTRVKRMMEQSTLLHISCHGDFVQAKPEATGLRLMNATGADETLSLPDLFDLDLRRLNLAVLMSCWGADNFILPGRWVLSLPEVLWRAGTTSVVASLWEVSEEFAIDFVTNFYAALPDLPVDQALQRAQLLAIRESPAENVDPVDWAGFQVYGNTNRFRT